MGTRYNKRNIKFRGKRGGEDILLYFIAIISLIQVFYLIVNEKYKSFLFFCIIGLVLKLFIKNTSYVLIIDIIVTNLLMKTLIKQEGMETASVGMTGSTGSVYGSTGSVDGSSIGGSTESFGAGMTGTSNQESFRSFGRVESFSGGNGMDMSQIHTALDRIEPLMVKLESMGSMFGFNSDKKKTS